MNEYIESLASCVLFENMSKSRIGEILKLISYKIEIYDKGSTIAVEGENCDNLGIILKGNIEVHKPFPSGKIVTINHFSTGDIFGEALIFSGKHIYPATILSTEKSKIMLIKKNIISKLMTMDENVLNNFMGVLSNRILMLNDRLANLGLNSLRKKISNIILIEYKRQDSLNITLPHSRKKMAELLNIPRPSLSRELINMREEGLIEFNKNIIKILDLDSIRDSLT